MKRKEPLISIILKGFAIVAGLIALWRLVAAFVVPQAFAAQGGIYTMQAGIFVGSALVFWWMGEVTTLLARIAANTEGSQRRP
jgi:hypothetical protein